MPDIVLFKPKSELNVEANLDSFIRLCKNELTIFGPNLNFDEPVWDITGHVKAKAKSHKVRLVFSDWDSASKSSPVPITEPFASFAKAYLRYQQGFRAVIDLNVRLTALRAIDKALNEAQKVSPVAIDNHILNRAASLIEEKFSPERGYRLGQQLELISLFLNDHRLTHITVHWKNPIKRPANHEKVGIEFDERRREKLPSAYELDALARAYRLAETAEDRIVTSIAAIMCATPDRISEILTLPVHCVHNDRLPDGTQVYGLRYWPAKGADPMIKWVIPSMTDLVQEAIARIKRHTQSARDLAKWYEDHPNMLFLPTHLQHLRGAPLSFADVAEIVFGSSDLVPNARIWLTQRKIISHQISFSAMGVRFEDVERAVLATIPRGFPYLDPDTSLKYSESLCVINTNLLHQKKLTQICSFEAISHGQVESGLGNATKHGKSSVFSRLEILNDDGSQIKINTHQFRHYLNTLAMAGGLDELDIAKWSGRKDVRQNRAYDHISAQDKLALIRDAIGNPTKMFGPLATLPKGPLIRREDFATIKVTSAHTTEFGYCIHDYVISPCQIHMDCLNCNELVCIKGDEAREANIRRQRDETKELLVLAEAGVQEGAQGANRWVEHQTQTLQRLDDLCELLDNPWVKPGAVIQLKGIRPASRLVQAAESRGIEVNPKKGKETLQPPSSDVMGVLKLLGQSK